MPGVIAGTILSFILAMNAYATPVLLGGPTFQMMGPTVLQPVRRTFQLAVRRRDVAFVLMTATLLLTVTSELARARPLPALTLKLQSGVTPRHRHWHTVPGAQNTCRSIALVPLTDCPRGLPDRRTSRRRRR